MIAGGLGSIAARQTHKIAFPAGTLLVHLGGPGMRIGMGGGAASSMAAGANAAELDFDSVQRGNPEIQRRAQEVINHCTALGDENPILAIHDVGAGGISNAFPELVDGAGRGARFDLRKVPVEESGLAPHEIWCNESQERYVMAVAPDALAAVRRDVRARALPVRGRRRRHRGARAGGRRVDCGRARDRRPAGRSSSTCRSTCCSASRRRCTATCAAARRRCRRSTSATSSWRRSRSTCCATRRSPASASSITIGDRTVGGLSQPRSDGRAVAGAGRRLRRHARRLRRLRRRGDGDGRAHAARRRSTRRPRAGWRSARRSPICSPRRSRSSASSSAATGWPRAATIPRRPATTPRSTTPCSAVGDGALPGARHQRAGRQGQPVDAHALDATTTASAKQVTAPVSLVVTAFATLDDVRATLDAAAAARRHDARARRPRPRPDAHGRLDARAGASASSATRCPISTIRRC